MLSIFGPIHHPPEVKKRNFERLDLYHLCMKLERKVVI